MATLCERKACVCWAFFAHALESFSWTVILSRAGPNPVGPFRGRPFGKDPCFQGGETMALLIILALIVALLVGLGFVVKWLFILAVIAALLWVIAFFMRGARA